MRGWIEIREELTSEAESFLSGVKTVPTETLLDTEQKQFIHKGWSIHTVEKGNSYFFTYLYYGGNIHESDLPYFREILQWLADRMNYWDGPLRVYPTGEFVLEEGEGNYVKRWRIADGTIEGD